MAKTGSKWQKIMSVFFHISEAVHHMIVICVTQVWNDDISRVFFHFFFKMTKNSICCAPYLRSCTSYDCHLLYTSVKWWYLKVFFIFSKFWFFNLLVGWNGKNGPKWQEFCLLYSISQEPYIIRFSFMILM